MAESERKIYRINGIALDVVISETPSFSSDVTMYPVEDGDDISDHVHNQPVSVSIEAIVNAIPLGLESERGENPLVEVRDALENLRSARTSFIYEGVRRVYKSMVFESLSFPLDPGTGDCLKISASMRQVNMRELVRVAARYRPATRSAPPGPGLWLCPPAQGIVYGATRTVVYGSNLFVEAFGRNLIKPQSSAALNKGLGCRKVVKKGPNYFYSDNGKKLTSDEIKRMEAQNSLPIATISGHTKKPTNDVSLPVANAPGADAVKVMSEPKPRDIGDGPI